MEGGATPGEVVGARPVTVILDTEAGQVKASVAAGGEWSVQVRGSIRQLWQAVCGGHDFSQVWVAEVPRPIQAPTNVGDRLAVDPPRRRVLVDGGEIQLSRREFDLLAVLARRTDRVFTKAELLKAVWGFEPRDIGDEHRVTAMVRNLRSRLAAVGAADLIGTVRGVGYELRTVPPAHPDAGGPEARP
ncbi:MAG TPA: winged helix-turn-helix domain-containing protein [Solirubrobacterales bacterium]|jgi:DNA-binding response OmpR family regulator|nr:winged helix-turn-helix domain-containing protein [Solirubrobacterales bacterium]